MQDFYYSIIHNVLDSRQHRKRIYRESLDTIKELMKNATFNLKKDNAVLSLHGDFSIVGDIHGNIDMLIRIFQRLNYPNQRKYLFLGDYVDRGTNSIEVIILLYALKCLFPDQVFLLRGNHEFMEVSRIYGFYDECRIRYSEELFNIIQDTFSYLPIAAILNDTKFCVHGGISQKINSKADILSLEKVSDIPNNIILDLLWSDPDPEVQGYKESQRGSGYLFGQDAIDYFLRVCGFTMVIRSHEHCQDGYELPFGNQGGLITVFSACDYCGQNNSAAVFNTNSSHENKLNLTQYSPIDRSKRIQIILPDFILEYINKKNVFQYENQFEDKDLIRQAIDQETKSLIV